MKIVPIIGIVGGIVVFAVILGISFSLNQNADTIEVEDALGKEIQLTENPEIENRLNEIKQNVEDTKNLESDYDPTRKREWVTSGPFQIDRSEYALGENIFIRIGQLELTEKGQIVFLRPLNSTHHSTYISIPFDGTDPPFNQYFTPDLSKSKGICSIEDIAGEWHVIFRGTNYESIKFTLSDMTFLPGEESRFEPIC